MKAVVFHGVGDVRVENVARPRIQDPQDAIVRLTSTSISGADLHLFRGTMGPVKPGTILGHEGVGVVEEVGSAVRNLRAGDRVVIPATLSCGFCSYCRAGYSAQCDRTNPLGSLAGATFYGGPQAAGGLHGLQAEFARIIYAPANLIKLPFEIKDSEAIFLSDVFPTGYFAARMAEVKQGDTVAVFGCGAVGLLAIASAKHLGAGRIFAVDASASRLAAARAMGAETIDFGKESPVPVLRELTGGIGVDRAIDAVGVDCASPKVGEPKPAYQALSWAVEALAKAGSLGIVGYYPKEQVMFPIGEALNKNLTIKMGICSHRKYIPQLMEMIRTGAIHPSHMLTQHAGIASAVDAYHAYNQKKSGWIKVQFDFKERALKSA